MIFFNSAKWGLKQTFGQNEIRPKVSRPRFALHRRLDKTIKIILIDSRQDLRQALKPEPLQSGKRRRPPCPERALKMKIIFANKLLKNQWFRTNWAGLCSYGRRLGNSWCCWHGFENRYCLEMIGQSQIRSPKYPLPVVFYCASKVESLQVVLPMPVGRLSID